MSNRVQTPPDHDSQPKGVKIMTMEEYLRTVRTLSAAEVDRRTAEHDAEDLRPSERLSIEIEDQS